MKKFYIIEDLVYGGYHSYENIFKGIVFAREYTKAEAKEVVKKLPDGFYYIKPIYKIG